jgi:VanZ family protein
MTSPEPNPLTPLPEGKGQNLPLTSPLEGEVASEASGRGVRQSDGVTSHPPPGGEAPPTSPSRGEVERARLSGKVAGGLGSPRFLLHLLVLLVFLGLWTWKLLEPNPVPEAISEKLKGWERFAAAKTLHVSGYCFLTLLTVTLPLPNYWRWFLAGLLALHGVATEIGQTFVPGRTGSVRDVLIDWGGVCAAVLIWRVFLAPRTRVRSKE